MNTSNDFDIKLNTGEVGEGDGAETRSSIIETITYSLLASPTITSILTSQTVSNWTENKDCY